MKMTKRILSLLLILVMALSFAPAAMAEGGFNDVASDDWFYESVDWAVEQGITQGVGGGLFGPERDCTRAQVVTFLWRSLGQPEPESLDNPFSDVKDTDWFFKAVLWAVEEGITNGIGGGLFGSQRECTRAQVATFLWRSLGKPAPESRENPFSDIKEEDWFFDAVLWAVENGITSGVGGGRFSPNSDCSRGQIVTFLYRSPASGIERPTPSHSCISKCLVCGLCMDKDCTEAICSAKCPGHKTGPDFPEAGYVTTATTHVVTDKLHFEIDPKVYVPGNLEELADILTAALEKVSGLSFDAGAGKCYCGDGKIHVYVTWDNSYVGQDWYQGLDTSELGNAYAAPSGQVYVSPGDLLLGQDYTISHELGHSLMFCTDGRGHSQLMTEGLAEYTSYLAQLELERSAPNEAVYVGNSQSNIFNMEISDYSKLYEQPLEYWFDNTFEYGSNANYVIGFRFMWYLNSVYGDYTKWVAALSESYAPDYSGYSTTEQQIAVLKSCYGEDVLDNFYPWLKKNVALFDISTLNPVFDMSKASLINLYPSFNAIEASVRLQNTRYNDLYINLETAKTYLKDYKGIDISNLKLTASPATQVILYKTDGSSETVYVSSGTSLKDVSYIRLPGSGFINKLSVSGFPGEVQFW